MRQISRLFTAAVTAATVSGCITASMQGYADRDPPTKPVQRIVTLVTAPGQLASSIQSSVASEAAKRRVTAQDALLLFPPTRTYTDSEIRKELGQQGVNGVLLIKVGDSGVIREYAGTVFSGHYSGSSVTDGA